jgi:hypothetical protein
MLEELDGHAVSVSDGNRTYPSAKAAFLARRKERREALLRSPSSGDGTSSD